mgnify:CR=1 FL=1
MSPVVRNMQLKKFRKIESRFAPAMDKYAEWETNLMVVTDNNKWEIQEKIAEILESEGEFGNHVDPADIYLRVGSISPFGKENDEILKEFENVTDKILKLETASEKIELDPYRVSIDAVFLIGLGPNFCKILRFLSPKFR